MSKFLPELRRAMSISLLLALAVRIAVTMPELVFAPERAMNASDPDEYIALAENMIERGVFSQQTTPPYTPDSIRTPGYPLMLALLMLVSKSQLLRLIVISQVILGAITSVLAGIASYMVTGSVRASWFAGLGSALAPAAIILTGFGSAETLFAFLILLGALFIAFGITEQRLALSLAGGLVLGFAVLTRPIALMLLPVLAAAPLFNKPFGKAWRHSAVIAAAFFAVSASWMGRNAVVFGEFSLSSISDINLLYYNASSLVAHQQGISFYEARELLGGQVKDYPLPENDWPTSREAALARKVILDHPVQFAFYNGIDALNGVRPGYSYMLLLLTDPSEASNHVAAFRSGTLLDTLGSLSSQGIIILFIAAFMTLATAVLIVGGLTGLIILTYKRQWFWSVLLGGVVAVLTYLPGAASNARFRAPVEPLLAVLSAVAIQALHTHVSSHVDAGTKKVESA